MFRFIVLGLLRNGGTLHGYALMKAYRSRTGVQMSTGTFYRELQNLVAEGLVCLVDRAPDVDARRTPYQITPQGCDLFDRWLVRPPIIALGSDDELTARTMFLHEAQPEIARKMIDAWKEELWLLSKKFERDRQSELHRCASEGTPFSILVLLLARRLRHLAGDVEYLDELRSALESLPAPARRSADPAAKQGAKMEPAAQPDDKRLRVRTAAAGPTTTRTR
jgi:DNA-binding PadR family transcriptional regulator